MINLKPAPTFTAPVEISVPGREKPAKVKLTFKYQTAKEHQAFWDERGEAKIIDCIPELVTGWDGVDADFSEDNLKEFLENYPTATQEILNQYSRLLFESRVKN